ncbi:MAG: conserved membrane protein of unknown function [Candidatus Thorarchaeota archaeon]|nr:MAG: conserved membrane protein of unknown function [Candidatus Thorarchaeota archaeon]
MNGSVSTRVRTHRYISWFLVLISILIVGTGYMLSRGLSQTFYYDLSLAHRVLEVFFILLFVTHMLITIRYFGINWRRTISLLMQNRGTNIQILRLAQRISSWLIVIFTLMVIVPGLNGYEVFAQIFEESIPFGLHRFYDVFLVSMIIIHSAFGVRFALMRRRFKWKHTNFVLSLVTILLVLNVVLINIPESRVQEEMQYSGTILIGSKEFGFQASDIASKRPDVFKNGSFSMFDILAHVAERGDVQLDYYFNETMNTYVIESLNGESYWWYRVEYSGGWPENNVFRMDHYPWKPETELSFYRVTEERLEETYSSFMEESERKTNNADAIIIPEVTIRGRSFFFEAENVSVTAHNLRNDTFQDGVITAIDVIMSLGDQGLLVYDIEWFESIGSANVVRNYYVVQINADRQAGTCGFVYESGDLDYRGILNHIHLPADARVLNSPEYMTWFWICL